MGNGMKSGSGDDPFADMDDTASEEERDETAESEGNLTTETTETSSASGIPWKFTRDNAKAEREMVQFFLQDATKRLESRAQGELETKLEDDVLLLDVREAAYQVALEEHLDDVADQLREWGYDAE
ncbi:hypothetical protein [Salinibaculum rarum]|uniref:hypothetical protein n=1 Tax=Salinibaculum rarum TaxID=3058903 RepID=UPI00265EC4C6|nr:hypothetical protein [Salinibaculum sp. KK48]